jgi:hypothetical protein
MTESKRYDQPLEVSFGGQTITAAPLKGLTRLRAFEAGVVEEIHALQTRVEQHLRQADRISPEALLDNGVNQAKLLKLGLPEIITDELLEESTARERAGLLSEICYLNNLGRFVPFLHPEMLVDLAMRINLKAPDFPMPARNGSSSEPASAGATSSAS